MNFIVHLFLVLLFPKNFHSHCEGRSTLLPSLHLTTKPTDNVTLPCNISQRLHSFDILSWLLVHENKLISVITIEMSMISKIPILLHGEDPARFTLVMDTTTGVFNLVIIKVMESDSGDYHCVIRGRHKTWHFGEGIRLVIKGSTRKDFFHPLNQTFVTEPKGTVKLPCQIAAEKSRAESWLWLRQHGYKLTLLLDTDVSKLTKSVTSMRNLDDAHFVLDHSGDVLSLVINGVRESDLGVYYCIAQGPNKSLYFGDGIKVSFREPSGTQAHPERALMFTGCALAALTFLLATFAAVKATNYHRSNPQRLKERTVILQSTDVLE